MNDLLGDTFSRSIAQIVAVVVVSRLIGLVTRRMGQPMVIAEITAGILLGPSLLGWAFPDFSAALFAPGSLVTMNMLSQLGLVLFVFLIGVELDHRLLRGRGPSSVLIANASVWAPFALGAALALYLYPRFAAPGASFTRFALFMGAAMSITACPVLARILDERRLLRSRVGAVTVTCAAAGDVTAWCVVAFVVAGVGSIGLVGALTTTALALLYIVSMLALVRPLLVRLAARVATPDAMSPDIIAAVLALVLVSSWTTHLIGIHALFGAFLFGAILPKDGGFARALGEKLQDLVLIVLLPLFFAYSGLRTEIWLLDSAYHWAVCGLVVVVATVGKAGGGALAARLSGLSWREAGALGVLLNTRGLMGLIVLNIGLDLGIISPTLFSMMIIMALVTTFAATPLLQWIYPTEQMAHDVVAALQAPEEGAPAEYRILACISHEQSARGLLAMAAVLLGPGETRRVYALHLAPGGTGRSLRLEQAEQEVVPLAPAIAEARNRDVEVKPLSFVSPDPAADICRVASVRQADAVLLGWHKPILGRTVLGGVVREVMRDATSTVAVFLDRGLDEVDHVLVPFLGSPHDRAALALARRLTASTGAAVTVLDVVPHGGSGSPGAAGLDGVRVETVEHDCPEEATLARSAEGVDLVIAGVGLEAGAFSATSERLMRRCRASMLLVRGARLARAQVTQD